jgi:2'-5' RNA ligase
MRAQKDIRLFFALWPGATLRASLQDAADSIVLAHAARRVPAANLHLTLHFIGNVHFDDMTCMRSQARLVDASAFQLSIDRQGCFARPRVAWLGCSNIPEALVDLHRQLGARLQSCGYQPEARPYHPHITVARKVEAIGDDPAFAPLSWWVDSFALVEVQPAPKGVQYRVVESWPLH